MYNLFFILQFAQPKDKQPIAIYDFFKKPFKKYF